MNHCFHLSRDVVLWNINKEEESITFEGMHSTICMDMLVYYDQTT